MHSAAREGREHNVRSVSVREERFAVAHRNAGAHTPGTRRASSAVAQTQHPLYDVYIRVASAQVERGKSVKLCGTIFRISSVLRETPSNAALKQPSSLQVRYTTHCLAQVLGAVTPGGVVGKGFGEA